MQGAQRIKQNATRSAGKSWTGDRIFWRWESCDQALRLSHPVEDSPLFVPILVTAPLCWRVSLCKHVSSIGESDSLCPVKWRRRYSGSRLLETRSKQGIWEVTLYNLLPSALASHVIRLNGNVYWPLAQTATCLYHDEETNISQKTSIGQSMDNDLLFHTWAQFGNIYTGDVYPHFFRQGGHNMPCPPTFFSLGFCIWRGLKKLKWCLSRFLWRAFHSRW